MRNALLILVSLAFLGMAGCVQQTVSTPPPAGIEKIVTRDDADGKTTYRYEPHKSSGLSAFGFQPAVAKKGGKKTLQAHLHYSTQSRIAANAVHVRINNDAPVKIAAVLERSERQKDKYATIFEETVLLSGMTPDTLQQIANAQSVVFHLSGAGAHDIPLTAQDQEGIRWLLSVLQAP